MKLRYKTLMILFLVVIVFVAGCGTYKKTVPPDKYCEKDVDCVPNKRCHPTDVVNKDYQLPLENETGCTEDCRTILDCGRAKPVCSLNRCVIKRIW